MTKLNSVITQRVALISAVLSTILATAGAPAFEITGSTIDGGGGMLSSGDGLDFRITRSTIDGGGVTLSSGDGFELSGTIGQPDAGVTAGGAFELVGGFWFAVPPGDTEQDGDVDLFDHLQLVACLTGPDELVSSDCRVFDVDRDGAIDLRDVAIVQRGFTGS